MVLKRRLQAVSSRDDVTKTVQDRPRQAMASETIVVMERSLACSKIRRLVFES